MTGVIYARYSSENQREESIEGQLRECKVFAEKNGIRIIDTYIDRALSAKTDNRPAFQKMIRDSAKGVFDTILVWKLDRFARNRYDSAHYKALLRKNGARVISATEVISQGAEGIILESILEGMAEYYSAELAEKITRGQNENAYKCKHNGGARPFGYIVTETQEYEIHPEEASCVVNVYQMYDDGATMKQIAETLNNQGIRNTRGGLFTVNSISTMLSNRRYIGEYAYRDIVVPNGVPAIVPMDLFGRIQKKLTKNKKAPAHLKADVEYILSTKLFCGKCGAFMIGESGTGRSKTTYRYYKCHNNKRKKRCDKKAVKKDWIEDIVINRIVRVLWDDVLIDQIVDAVMELQEQDNMALPLLRAQLAETEKGINNLVNAIERGIITTSTKKRLDELEERKSDIEIKIAQETIKKPLLTPKQMLSWFHKLRKVDITDTEQRKRLVDIFVNAIIVHDDKIEFYFNYKEDAETLSVSSLLDGSDMVEFTPPKPYYTKPYYYVGGFAVTVWFV